MWPYFLKCKIVDIKIDEKNKENLRKKQGQNRVKIYEKLIIK